MSRNVTRRFLMGGAASLIAVRAAAAEPPTSSLRPVLRGEDLSRRNVPEPDQIIRGQNLSGEVAFAVAEVGTGARLEQSNAQEGTPPASVAKALTALYALDILGPDHRFETRLLATGGITGGEIQGDLILAGGGDPTLDTDALGTMAANLKEAGIIGVKGDFLVYQAALPVEAMIDPEQPDHVGYNPSVSGIALNYNRVHFEWKRGGDGYDVSMEGRSAKYRPGVQMAQMRVIDRKAPVYTYTDAGLRDEWTVARRALGNGGARWLPVRKPGLYAGDVFATLARSNGIVLGTPKTTPTLPQDAKVLVTQRSGDLRGILKDMLKWSTNLTAEMVGMAASKKRVPELASLRASAEEMNRWAMASYGLIGPRMADHSGLSDDSRLTASDMVTALLEARGEGLRPILKSIRLRDSRGRPDGNHPIKVAAKTGTLNFVSGLAGYMVAEDGKELAFAIFAADAKERAQISREERERPPGARGWNARAKRVQQELIERWSTLYGA